MGAAGTTVINIKTFSRLAAACAVLACCPILHADRPNIVIILADDLGIGDLVCYNEQSKIPTPNIDRIAAQGMRFTDAHSPSAVCSPTRYGLLTGRYAWRSRLKKGVLFGYDRLLIEPGRPTIASMLKDVGYRTAVIGKWHLGLGSYDPTQPNQKTDYSRPFDAGPHTVGFDDVFIVPASLDMPPYLFIKGDRPLVAATEQVEGSQRRWSGGNGFWRAGPIAPGLTHEQILPTLADEAVAFIESQTQDASEDPFFLYFALTAPHTPWVPTKEFQGKSEASWYGDFVAQVDHVVGRIANTLAAAGIADDTLLIVTSDNGAHWRPQDIEEYGHAANLQYRGMKADIHEGGHRVPFIVRWPGVVASGSQSDALIGLNDIYATLADVVANELRPDEAEDSESFFGILRAQLDEPTRSPLIHHSIDGMFAIRDGDWKYIRGLGSGGFTQPKRIKPAEGEPDSQLYNLRDDPEEQTNISGSNESIAARLDHMIDVITTQESDYPSSTSQHCGPSVFATDFSQTPDRVWIGSDFWANRLQDWRIANERIECTEARANLAVRTCHFLTWSIPDRHGTSIMLVRTGPIETGDPPSETAFSGFLIGAGNDLIDYRLSAQTHHRPAPDGGMLAVVDHAGRVYLRDFSHGGGGGSWAIGGKVEPDQIPILALGSEPVPNPADSFILRLRIWHDEDGCRVELRSTNDATGAVISTLSLDGIDATLIDGNIALVSHLGAQNGNRGHWFDDLRIDGSLIQDHKDRTFGPILTAQYTIQDNTLKLTAQSVPVGPEDPHQATLQIKDTSGAWIEAATADLVPDSYTFPFRIENWSPATRTPYRVVYEIDNQTHTFEGLIRAEPTDDTFTIASLNCAKIFTGNLQWNHDAIWFPHNETLAAIQYHDPDLLFFAGDQIYEGDLTPAQTKPEDAAILDYLYKWYRFCWSFAPVMADRPTITIPDEHDVYHGNLWSAGGKRAVATKGTTAQDAGGYKMSPRFVNAVHRTQTSHLPDPVDPDPSQDISVYFTRMDYAGISFAILADRQFKSAPKPTMPEARIVNGWSQDPDWNAASQGDVPGAILLGDRQLAFLNEWAIDYSRGTWAKVALSQTIFSNVATLPEGATSGSVIPSLPYLESGEYPANYHLAADMDSNGWPQTGRNKAIRALRRGFAIHLAGDQHLASLTEYGVDEWRDAGFAFCSPAIANTWPRRWFPPEPGLGREPGTPTYTGDHLDGFGNKMTVYAVANPHRSNHEPTNLHNRVPGYGIIKLNRATRRITFECWPRWTDPSKRGAQQYDGWPRTIDQIENYAPPTALLLPTISVSGITDPVVQIIDQGSNYIEYALRIRGTTFQPFAPGPGPFTIRIGDPDTNTWKSVHGVRPDPENTRTIHIEF